MILAEQELTVQVADFNIIIVRAVNLSPWPTSDSHKSECFDVLAAEGSSTYHKSVNLSKFFLDFTSKNLDLIIVSGVCWSSVNFALRNSLKDVVVQPLFKRTVFTSKLYDFLSDNSTEECSLSANRTCWIYSSVVNHGLINAFNCFCSLCFSLFVDALGKRKYLCLVALAWILVMLLMESVDCSKCKMKLNWSSKVS